MPPGIGYGPLARPAPPTLGRVPNVQMPSPGGGAAPGPQGLLAILQRPGIRDALLATGMGLLQQKNQPGSFGQALGNALPQGVQAYRGGQQQAALDEVLQEAPDSMQRLIRALPRGQRAAAAFQMMQPPEPTELKTVTDAQGRPRSFNPQTGEFGEPVGPADEDSEPAEIQALERWIAANPDMSPAEAMASFYAARRGPGTTVNVGPAESAAQKAIGEQIAGVVGEDAANIRQAQPVLTSLERAIEITESPEFESVTGPTRPIGEIIARLSDDPTARQLQQEFDLITGGITLEKLQAFTGQKSEKELEMAQRLASGDRSMNADALRAGLRYIKRVMEAEQVEWAERMLELDPELYNIDPRMIEQQRNQARQILQRYGSGTGSKDPGRFGDLVPGGSR